MGGKGYTIALAGNPNCGKTTIFNSLTGSSQKIGNLPGVTVEKKEGLLKLGMDTVNVVDLPGIYSFSLSGAEDERIACDYLLNEKPDLVINIIDSANLARNLYLTTQLIETGVPVITVLNRADLAEKKNIKIDAEAFSVQTGCPAIILNALNKKDIDKLKNFLQENISSAAASVKNIEYPSEAEKSIEKIAAEIKKHESESHYPERWSAVRILEGDERIKELVLEKGILSEKAIENESLAIRKNLGDSFDIVAADSRYGFISRVVELSITREKEKPGISEKIDSLVTGRFTGIPIFLFVMYLVFWVTVNVGSAFIDFFDIAFGAIFVEGLGMYLESLGAPGFLTALLAGGVGTGVQTVATFVPIIFAMFLMLTILEDSGYMSRAAFVMDRLMRSVGLPGKSFVPMLVGFGCTVPAISATRTLETRRDRLMTIFMAPFMSCGARLPVYALFGVIFFQNNAGFMVFTLYLAGIALAIATGLLLKNTLFKGEPSYFIMELPPYNAPRPFAILRDTWNRLKLFVLKAGKVIVAVVIVLSLLNSIGRDGSLGNEDSENSVLAAIGQTINPVFEPMGIEKGNWPVSVSIFTGIFAKEVILGTLNSLYTQMNITSIDEDKDGNNEGGEGEAAAQEEEFSIMAKLGEALGTIPENLAGLADSLLDPLGIGLISEDSEALAEELEVSEGTYALIAAQFPKGAMQVYPFILFVLVYFPCVAAFGAIVQEAGMRAALVISTYLTLLGWITATLFYQITLGHSFIWIAVPLIMLGLIIYSFYLMGKKKYLLDQ